LYVYIAALMTNILRKALIEIDVGV